jgi:hypothetical protein
MTGCHDDASGLADRSQTGEGVAGWTTGRRSGGGRHGAARPESVRASNGGSQGDRLSRINKRRAEGSGAVDSTKRSAAVTAD